MCSECGSRDQVPIHNPEKFYLYQRKSPPCAWKRRTLIPINVIISSDDELKHVNCLPSPCLYIVPIPECSSSHSVSLCSLTNSHMMMCRRLFISAYSHLSPSLPPSLPPSFLPSLFPSLPLLYCVWLINPRAHAQCVCVPICYPYSSKSSNNASYQRYPYSSKQSYNASYQRFQRL